MQKLKKVIYGVLFVLLIVSDFVSAQGLPGRLNNGMGKHELCEPVLFATISWCKCVNHGECGYGYDWESMQDVDDPKNPPKCDLGEIFDREEKVCLPYSNCSSEEVYNPVLEICMPLNQENLCPIESIKSNLQKDGSLLCTCEDGTNVPGGTPHCPSDCPENSFKYEGHCVCDDGFVVNDAGDGCVKFDNKCSDGTTEVGGYYNIKLCKCPKGKHSDVDGGSIIRAGGFEKCVDDGCGDNSTMDDNGYCRCNAGFERVPPLDKCVVAKSVYTKTYESLEKMINGIKSLKGIKSMDDKNMIATNEPVLKKPETSEGELLLDQLEKYVSVNKDLVYDDPAGLSRGQKQVYEGAKLLAKGSEYLGKEAAAFFGVTESGLTEKEKTEKIKGAGDKFSALGAVQTLLDPQNFTILQNGLNTLLSNNIYHVEGAGKVANALGKIGSKLPKPPAWLGPVMQVLDGIHHTVQLKREGVSTEDAVNIAGGSQVGIYTVYTTYPPIAVLDAITGLTSLVYPPASKYQASAVIKESANYIATTNDEEVQQAHLQALEDLDRETKNAGVIKKTGAYFKAGVKIGYAGIVDAGNKVYKGRKYLKGGMGKIASLWK